MKFVDYYTTLGVSRSASAEEIKRSYRKLAKEWHPDRHPPHKRKEVEEKFKAISEANEVLSDPEKRKRYDALGEHWRHGQDFQGQPGGGGRTVSPEEFARMFGGAGAGAAGGGGFSDFFAQMFGDMFAGGRAGGPQPRGGRPQAGAGHGEDAEAEIELKVGEALLGGKRPFVLAVRVPCETCGGSGQLGMRACPACGGLGSARREKSIELSIPKDVRDGQVLRLRGLGEPGPGGAGDLLLTLRLVGDDVYRLRDDDVEADVVVAPWELLEGTKIEVAVPGGNAVARLPAGTRAGQKLRLRGQGLARSDGTRGDLLLVVRLGLPESLTEAEQALLRQLGQTAGPVRGGAAK
ncbi:MAG: DnaJ domain-containing protein [Planctomycetes bacterium]|jgi:curved DNA-binding protein|nr:DnaJ domain-containing protein [Planctomycetota bacterium]